MNAHEHQKRTFQLTLHKPFLGLGPKPTVVVDGSAEPAQWGHRNWKVPGAGSRKVTVFLFNRWWKYGQAEFTVEPGEGQAFSYRPPMLPFLAGKVRRER